MLSKQEEDNTPNTKSKEDSSSFSKERLIIISELLFVLVPFIVITIIHLSTGNFSDLIYTADWSMAAVILYGQTIVKLILGFASYEDSSNWRLIGLYSALIIVFGLIPSAITLTLFIISKDQGVGIIIVQFSTFLSSIIIFLVFGTIGQGLSSNHFLRRIGKALDRSNKKRDK